MVTLEDLEGLCSPYLEKAVRIKQEIFDRILTRIFRDKVFLQQVTFQEDESSLIYKRTYLQYLTKMAQVSGGELLDLLYIYCF